MQAQSWYSKMQDLLFDTSSQASVPESEDDTQWLLSHLHYGASEVPTGLDELGLFSKGTNIFKQLLLMCLVPGLETFGRPETDSLGPTDWGAADLPVLGATQPHSSPTYPEMDLVSSYDASLWNLVDIPGDPCESSGGCAAVQFQSDGVLNMDPCLQQYQMIDSVAEYDSLACGAPMTFFPGHANSFDVVPVQDS